MPDAVVIGSGPNGLVAANILRDHGWSVVVLEAANEPGGAVRSSELMEPGFINDHCSSFYPLGAASPVIKSLNLEQHGLRWRRSPLVVAHASVDGVAPALSTDIDESMVLLGADAGAWKDLYDLWCNNRNELLSALFTPFPPIGAGVRLGWKLRGKPLLRFARLGVLPVRRLCSESFSTDEATKLLAGLALHADLLPESALSGFFGWLLASLAQDVGFPVPEGGAGKLTGAMVSRLHASGGEVICNKRVESIIVRNGRAVAVRCSDGSEVQANRAVLADVDAQTLYLSLLPANAIDSQTRTDIQKFHRDDATVKVDWNLNGPIPWKDERVHRAATVHVGEGIDQLSETASLLARSVIPKTPFMLLGQMSVADPTRQPHGKETVWAYTHVPRSVRGDAGGSITGSWNGAECDSFADRMENEIEARAPGFKHLIRQRIVHGPLEFESQDANLVGGALGGGTAQLHQQLVFRPVPGMGRPETPVRGVFLASSSAHPGGGVHGACGANAARAALLHRRFRQL